MGRGIANHFNRGEIDPAALAREDLKRVNNSASSMINFIPMRLGPMMYRPGTEYIESLSTASIYYMVPFISAVDDTAILAFHGTSLEFFVNDVQIETTAGAIAVTNGNFTTNIATWTAVTPGSTSIAWYDYGTGDGAAALTGDGTNSAVFHQTLGTSATESFLRIVVERAPVVLKLGTTGVSSYDIFSGTLRPGEHVLAFDPSSAVTITFENSRNYRTLINSCVINTGAVDLSIGTNLTNATMSSLRSVQSGDIVYCVSDGIAPFQIEHRGDKSWSVVDYRCDDGPFEPINNTDITLTPAALIGDTTLTASEDFFESDHVGALFKVGSEGQEVTASVSAADAGTGSIRVFGVDDARKFSISVSGTFTATVTLQRSADNSSWEDVEDYTIVTSKSYDDTLDNAVLYYRLWVKTGDYTSGTAVLDLVYAAGSIEGICRVTKYTSSTVVEVQVLTDFGDLDATKDWYEGSWSAAKQWPTAVELEEGRLCFAGKDATWLSVSDSYYSFDRGIEGDSASIYRSIGFGPVDHVKWMKSGDRLVMGAALNEIAVRSSSYGEILTPSTVKLKSGSNQGSDEIEPIVIDGIIYFVQRSGNKLYSLASYADRESFDTMDVNLMNASIVAAGIRRLAFTRQPETRIFAVLDDGNVAVYTVDRSEDVQGWSRLTIDGTVEDVTVLPDSDEDHVYFVVQRDIDGGTVQYLEKMAHFSESIGGTVSKTFDSFETYTSPGTTITGLSHLEGETVGVWADGQDRGDFTVTGGQITVPSSWTDVLVGLRYTADYVSNKISGYQRTTALTERKRIIDTGVCLMNYWPGSLKIGPSVADLDSMPGIEDGNAVDLTATISDYSELPFEFDGETEADPRIYMRATGPVTVLALTYDVEGNDEAADSTDN